MSKNEPATVDCPQCGKPVPWTRESRWKPFCSERCRLIDLGAWFSEEHSIPGEAAAPGEHKDDASEKSP